MESLFSTSLLLVEKLFRVKASPVLKEFSSFLAVDSVISNKYILMGEVVHEESGLESDITILFKLTLVLIKLIIIGLLSDCRIQ